MANIAGQQVKQTGRKGNGLVPAPSLVTHDEAFGYPRDFLENQFVYLTISPRAGGLSIGVNVNPMGSCNFDCLYCEVDHTQPARAPHLDVERMSGELKETLDMAYKGRLREHPRYASLPPELLQVRQVALSGDGEPTLSSQFVEAVQAVIHIRAVGGFFKTVLVTNSTALDQPQVQEGLRWLRREDEVWAKLEGGT